MSELVVGLDLGGTQIRTALADMQGKVQAQRAVLTLAQEGPQAVLARIRSEIETVKQDHAVQAIGIGVPGPTDPYEGVILMGPNLPGWRNVNMRQELGHLWLPRSALAHLPDLEDDILMSTSWVILRCQQSGMEFIYLNTHLSDASEDARQAGNALNLKQLKALEGDGALLPTSGGRSALPVLMSGDFNCNPWSPVYRQLLDAGFVDAYRAAGHADSVESSTFHGFQGSSYFALEWGDQVFWRVDWIVLRSGQRQLQTTSCTIVRDAEPPIYVSDHYPLVAEVLVI